MKIDCYRIVWDRNDTYLISQTVMIGGVPTAQIINLAATIVWVHVLMFGIHNLFMSVLVEHWLDDIVYLKQATLVQLARYVCTPDLRLIM